MIGAIIGDVIGSVYEWEEVSSTDFILFKDHSRITDDSVLSFAVADAILTKKTYKETIHSYGNRYPNAGYGGRFRNWLKLPVNQAEPYDSFGNGSAMRVSAVGYAFDDLAEVLKEAEASAIPSHNHPEGVKGAQAIAGAIWMARQGKTKQEIKEWVSTTFDYNLDRTTQSIKQYYKFDVTCQGSVPEAIISFLESEDVESAIRIGISLNGDSDTIACMAGGIAQAFYRQIPKAIYDEVLERLPDHFIELLKAFEARYQITYELI
ncbi:MAG: ADP-ribosylglycohydrolase family protein [Flammeovirgaceae bacterium]